MPNKLIVEFTDEELESLWELLEDIVPVYEDNSNDPNEEEDNRELWRKSARAGRKLMSAIVLLNS